MTATERWLRGPVPDMPVALQPAAHALLQAQEEIVTTISAMDAEALSARPGRVASLAWHVFHVSNSTDRLLTYARGEPLDETQHDALAREGAGDFPGEAALLVLLLQSSFDQALTQLRDTDPATLADPRAVGRMRLPSTVGGLIFHAAEHAARHAGQVATTARVVRAERAS